MKKEKSEQAKACSDVVAELGFENSDAFSFMLYYELFNPSYSPI